MTDFKRVPGTDLAVSAAGAVLVAETKTPVPVRIIHYRGREYRVVRYADRRWFVHRLVALAWLPEHGTNDIVLFRDGDTLNVPVTNLYWERREHFANTRRSLPELSAEDRALSRRELADKYKISLSTAYRWMSRSEKP